MASSFRHGPRNGYPRRRRGVTENGRGDRPKRVVRRTGDTRGTVAQTHAHIDAHAYNRGVPQPSVEGLKRGVWESRGRSSHGYKTCVVWESFMVDGQSRDYARTHTCARVRSTADAVESIPFRRHCLLGVEGHRMRFVRNKERDKTPATVDRTRDKVPRGSKPLGLTFPLWTVSVCFPLLCV